MADQLSLRLEADTLPDLPELRPMLPRPLSAPFDSDQHLFEPWWGGERALVMIGPTDLAGSGEVRVVDAAGRDLSGVLPELSGLAVRVAARSAILDGELVVVDGTGRADARELARRLSGASGAPSAFLCFDLLHLDGRSLLSQPLVRRREALRRTCPVCAAGCGAMWRPVRRSAGLRPPRQPPTVPWNPGSRRRPCSP
ncbi:MAG: hypothetical protein HY262_04500 [Chloroflexi bacterium]|nr:hypothetical protein [Chloroflexota bacterium]